MMPVSSSASRTAARRLLLGGGKPSVVAIKPAVDAKVAVAAREVSDAFDEFCKTTVALGCHSQAIVDSWKAEIDGTSGSDVAARLSHTTMLLDRALRGCRAARIVVPCL